MATSAASITFKVRDGKGQTAQVRLYIADQWVNADEIHHYFVGEFAGLLDKTVSGQIVGANGNYSLVIPESDPPDPDSDVEEKLAIKIRDEYGHQTVINIPTADESLFRPGTDELDMADPRAAALITAVLGGIDTGGGTYIQPQSGRGADLVEAVIGIAKYVARRGRR